MLRSVAVAAIAFARPGLLDISVTAGSTGHVVRK